MSSQTASCNTFHWISSASIWSYTTQSGYDNGNYNDVGGLVPLAANSWSVTFVYSTVADNTSDAAVVLSSQQYSSQILAQQAQPPVNLPFNLTGLGILVGSLVVQSGLFSPLVQSAYSTTFLPSPVTQHNSLLGIQGGTGGQYYHLTNTEYIGTGTGVFLRVNKPTFVGAAPYNIPYWAPDQTLTLTGSVQVYGGQYVLINSGSPNQTNPEVLLVYQVNTSSVNCIGFMESSITIFKSIIKIFLMVKVLPLI